MFIPAILAQELPDFSQIPGMQEQVPTAGFIAGLLIGAAIAMAIGVAIAALVAYLLFSCFESIPEQYRQMESWQAWLLLIPLFSIIWMFVVLPKLAKSYQAYFAEQDRSDVGDCGEQIGFFCAVSIAVAAVGGMIPCLGMIIGPIASLAGLVLLILFLVKAMTLKKEIA